MLNALRSLWNPAHWWPVWLIVFVCVFLVREITALATGRPQDTLSDWVWRVLRITRTETIAHWSAADFLTFGAWLVLVVWLTFHFFFVRFT